MAASLDATKMEQERGIMSTDLLKMESFYELANKFRERNLLRRRGKLVQNRLSMKAFHDIARKSRECRELRKPL